MTRNDFTPSSVLPLLGCLLAAGLAACGGETASEPTAHAAAPVIAPSGSELAPLDPPVHVETAAPEATSTPTLQPEATPTPEASLPEPFLGRSDFLRVRRARIATAVEDREPVEPGAVFQGDEERIYAFLELQNRDEYVRQVNVTFEHESGFATGDVTLDLPAEVWRWRTWAYTRHATRPGQWTAVVSDEHGEVIAEVPFLVTE